VSQQPLQWMGAATQTGKHGTEQATCAMCGTELPVSLMVPDGGEACTDVRWYCRDTVACTKRWTTAQARRADGDGEAAPGTLDDEQTGHDGPDGDQPERPVTGAPGAG
jgi:hypothetical protein